MEEVIMYKASDGRLFEHPHECERHEETISAQILDTFILGYDREGERINFASYDNSCICFAHVLKFPTDEEMENLTLANAWADYLDPDLEQAHRFRNRKTGWYVREPFSEMWLYWADYMAQVNEVKDVMVGLKEKWGA